MNASDRVINILDRAEERIHEIEDRSIEITQTEKEREKQNFFFFKSINNNVREHPRAMGHIEQSNLCTIGISKGEDKEWAEKIFEDIVAKNFPKLKTDTKL